MLLLEIVRISSLQSVTKNTTATIRKWNISAAFAKKEKNSNAPDFEIIYRSGRDR